MMIAIGGMAGEIARVGIYTGGVRGGGRGGEADRVVRSGRWSLNNSVQL